MNSEAKEIGLLVTTERKGVFFGFGVKSADSEIELKRARMCVYWVSDLKGVLGLASRGPINGCKIGPEVPSAILRGVVAVIECTPEAVKAWETAKW